MATLMAALWAHADTFRVDDSLTRVGKPVTEMQWRQFAPKRFTDNMVEGKVPVAVNLNLAPWLNRPARIYMALGQTGGPPVEARWETQGRLMPGSVRSGARTLVFQGVVSQASLQEMIFLTLVADGRELPNLQTLQFYFEIDVAS
jgi:hypothetical protein